MRLPHDMYYSRESIIILLTTSLSEGSALPIIIATMEQHKLWADHPFTYSTLRWAILLINHKMTVKSLTSWLRVKFLLGGSICKQLDNSTTSLTEEKRPNFKSWFDQSSFHSVENNLSDAKVCSVFKPRWWKPTSNKACIRPLLLFYSHTDHLK